MKFETLPRLIAFALLFSLLFSSCYIIRDRLPMEELIYPVFDGDEEEMVSDSPFSGGVLIANGISTIGGYAGDQIKFVATFTAEGAEGEVAEMRISGECQEVMSDDISWEPFKPVKSFQLVLPLGWSGFTVAVQFRDAMGNVSPVYCDDINVEGMAKPPDVD